MNLLLEGITLKELFKAIYYRNLKIEDVERKQDEFMVVLDALDKHKPRKPDYGTARKNLLINAKKIYDEREMIIYAFKNKTFLNIKAEMKMKAMMKQFETIPKLSNFKNKEETLRDIPDLESEESAAQRRNERGQGLKILTPSQMLSRLTISLAQVKAENNSQKL